MLLAGPIVCGMSQAANDWCDRHVDAINEPDRPIPSGRVPGPLGPRHRPGHVGARPRRRARCSAPGASAPPSSPSSAPGPTPLEPIRLKRSGWLGPGLVGLCYEGLPWFTGAAVLVAGAPSWPIILVALLYALGAHGIMTLNDFKALAGDRATGVNSLPVTLGPERAARLACVVMAVPQVAVILALAAWDRPIHAAAILALLLLQGLAMRVLLRDPKGKAPWYNATGVTLYVAGMMVAAFALRGLP